MLAFYLAFFLGRELTLFDQESKKQSIGDNFSSDKSFDTKSSSVNSSDDFNGEEKSQRERVKEYQEILSPVENDPKAQAEVLEKPIPPEDSIVEKKPEIYGLLIAKYQSRDTAIDKSSQLKIRFPDWDIFFKLSDDVYKVYIGPFKEKILAEKFLSDIKKKEEFKEVELEQIISSNRN